MKILRLVFVALLLIGPWLRMFGGDQSCLAVASLWHAQASIVSKIESRRLSFARPPVNHRQVYKKCHCPNWLLFWRLQPSVVFGSLRKVCGLLQESHTYLHISVTGYDVIAVQNTRPNFYRFLIFRPARDLLLLKPNLA